MHNAYNEILFINISTVLHHIITLVLIGPHYNLSGYNRKE